MRVALSLPPFGHLADPGAIVEIALAAEEAGFDGCFLWDHVYRPPTDPSEILDPWVLMGAMALVRQSLLDAGHHRAARLAYEREPLGRERPAANAALAALEPVLLEDQPLFVETDFFQPSRARMRA